MTNRIRFHRKPMAPAIPTPGQAYGYEENEDGSLRKQAPPNKDSSLGPAYYQIEHVSDLLANSFRVEGNVGHLSFRLE